MIGITRTALRSCRLLGMAAYQRRLPYFSAERIGSLQAKRVRRIVRHAYDTVPFYRRSMQERSLKPEDFRDASDLSKLPLIDKATVQQQPEAFQSTAVPLANCLALATSKGTKVFWDPRAAEENLAIAERERAVWRPLAGGRFACRQLHLLTVVSSTMAVRAFWDRRLRTPSWISRKHFFDPLRPYEEVIAELAEIRPHIVFSYGSYTEHFFRFLSDARIHPFLPRVWYYGADTLSPDWRAVVEKQFGVKVYSTYASVETSRVGFECELASGFHLNIDRVAVRLVGDDGRDVPAGQVGEVTISNLVNRATVLLNYRLGDLGEMSGHDCACGRHLPLLRGLQGRVLESMQLRDGRHITSAVFLGQFRELLHTVHRAQAVGLEPGRMSWRIVPGKRTDTAALKSAMLERCARVFGSSLEATVEFVEDIPLAPSGKFEAVKSSAERRATT